MFDPYFDLFRNEFTSHFICILVWRLEQIFSIKICWNLSLLLSVNVGSRTDALILKGFLLIDINYRNKYIWIYNP